MVRCAVIYLVMIFGLRLFGKREVGQFTLFDLVLVLLIANAVQPAMTGPDSSLSGGLIIIATLLLLNLGVGQLRERSTLFRRLVQPEPTVICQNGKWLMAALHREGIDLKTPRRRCGSTASNGWTASSWPSWRRTAASASCRWKAPSTTTSEGSATAAITTEAWRLRAPGLPGRLIGQNGGRP